MRKQVSLLVVIVGSVLKGCTTVATEPDFMRMNRICQSSEDPKSAPVIRLFGGNKGDGISSGQSVSLDPSGDIIIAGLTQGLGAYAGNTDLLLARIGSAGEIQWAHAFGGPQMDIGTAFARTADAGHIQAGDSYGHLHTGMAYAVSGSDTQRLLLLKTDSTGNYQWHKLYLPRVDEKGRGSNMYSVLQASDGGYLISGSVAMNPTGPKGPKGLWSDVLLARTDANGNPLWAYSYGSKGPDEAFASVESGDGGYVLAGAYSPSGDRSASDVLLLKVDLNGVKQWAKTFGGSGISSAKSVLRTSDGGFALVAKTDAHGAGGIDILLAKTDKYGQLEWAHTLGASGDDDPSILLQTSDGGFLITGDTTSFGDYKKDALIMKTDGAGKLQWARTFGGEAEDAGFSAIEVGRDSYIVVGMTESYGAGKQDIFTVQLQDPDSLGDCLQSVQPSLKALEIDSSDPALDEGEIELFYQSDSLRKQRAVDIQ